MRVIALCYHFPAMKKHLKPSLFSCLLHMVLGFRLVFATDILFNGFDPSEMLLYGNATLESRVLTLTNDSSYSIGRALYPTRIAAKEPNSALVLPFSTSFIFAMAPYRNVLPGHGIVFIFVSYPGIDGANSAQNLGFLNRTNNGNSSNHIFGVEFDVFKNEEFDDIDDNHVGINVNSLRSQVAHEAGYWRDDQGSNSGSDGEGDDDDRLFEKLKLNNGKNYQVWIDYADFHINVTMAQVGMRRPRRPLLSTLLNLSEVFQDEMYVGFTAATGRLVESHKILGWSFSNSNFSLSEALVTRGLPSFELPKGSVYRSKGFIAGMTLGLFFTVVMGCVVALFLIRRNRRIARERAEMEDWELEYWPHRITYQEVEAATKGFSDENVIGVGGNGKVYKGVLAGGAEIAIKRISCENSEGVRGFLAEISSLGRLKHRNLAGLRGWCKKEKGSLILVYDYMENGSLDKWVFECEESKMLGCEDRMRILKDVASGVFYLHEGWESRVLHRDIKASNVLLDKDMNGRLGDFGLARMHGHGEMANTTRVVGTVGYLAPEVVRSGRASAQTDVFGFGVLILEVMCGRRPIEEGKPPLVDWAWEQMRKGELVKVLDERLRAKGGLDEEEVERVLHLGLLCAQPDPAARPTMRQVVKILEGKNEGYESEGEEMDTYLLEKMKSKEMWFKDPQSSSHGSHPTFEEMRQAISSSMSLSWSDSILEGR